MDTQITHVSLSSLTWLQQPCVTDSFHAAWIRNGFRNSRLLQYSWAFAVLQHAHCFSNKSFTNEHQLKLRALFSFERIKDLARKISACPASRRAEQAQSTSRLEMLWEDSYSIARLSICFLPSIIQRYLGTISQRRCLKPDKKKKKVIKLKC